MEPTTQTNPQESAPVAQTTPNIKAEILSPAPKKSKAIYIIIIIVLIIAGVMILLKSKVVAPVSTETPVTLSAEDQKIDNDIVEATTFNNENDLKQIDKEF